MEASGRFSGPTEAESPMEARGAWSLLLSGREARQRGGTPGCKGLQEPSGPETSSSNAWLASPSSQPNTARTCAEGEGASARGDWGSLGRSRGSRAGSRRRSAHNPGACPSAFLAAALDEGAGFCLRSLRVASRVTGVSMWGGSLAKARTSPASTVALKSARGAMTKKPNSQQKGHPTGTPGLRTSASSALSHTPSPVYPLPSHPPRPLELSNGFPNSTSASLQALSSFLPGPEPGLISQFPSAFPSRMPRALAPLAAPGARCCTSRTLHLPPSPATAAQEPRGTVPSPRPPATASPHLPSPSQRAEFTSISSVLPTLTKCTGTHARSTSVGMRGPQRCLLWEGRYLQEAKPRRSNAGHTPLLPGKTSRPRCALCTRLFKDCFTFLTRRSYQAWFP